MYLHYSAKMALTMVMLLLSSLFLQGALGDIIICEELPTEICSFAISSSAKRCMLETLRTQNGEMKYECITSDAQVDTMREWIESNECINACGVDRNTVGISSDSLLNPLSTAQFCSHHCYHNCPNIINLYFNLALGEGVYLPELCEAQRTNPHRVLTEIRSSGASSGHIAASPIPY